MTTNKSFIAAAAGAMMLLSACNVYDTIYEASLTDHPDKGKIIVTADWSGIGNGITKPSSYTVSFDGRTFPATSDKCEPDDTFDPGNYKLYAYNTADRITVSGTTATANYASGTLGWLFTSAQSVTIEADKVHDLTAAMQQQVRQLTLVIEPTGGTADKISGITASLSGVAGSLDIDNDTHGTPSNVALTFTKDTDGKWKATVRLLGVTGTEQKLTGTITFTDALPYIPLESDLSAKLAGFNEGKNAPVALDGGVELHSAPGFTATIEGWKKVTGGTGIAN